MLDLENHQWPKSPLKAEKLDAEQIKQFLTIRADYEKSAFVTAGHLEVRQLGVLVGHLLEGLHEAFDDRV